VTQSYGSMQRPVRDIAMDSQAAEELAESGTRTESVQRTKTPVSVEKTGVFVFDHWS
jgi:hypothetical protein